MTNPIASTSSGEVRGREKADVLFAAFSRGAFTGERSAA
jgi:hypothetical protein